MRHRFLASVGVFAVVIAVVWLAPAPIAGQAGGTAPSAAANNWTPARTPWGEPDLQGMWDARTTIPLERPAEFGTREFMTEQEWKERERSGLNVVASGEDDSAADLVKADVQRYANSDKPDDGRPGYRIAGAEYNAFWSADPTKPKVSLRTSQIVDPPDGRMPPMTREALTRWQARHEARLGRGQADSFEDRAPMFRCLLRPGLPSEMLGNAQQPVEEIVQTPGYVTFVMPYGYVRIIPTDGRPHAAAAIRQWNGDSRGRWEGNTLVVETTNFNNKQDGGPILTIRRPWSYYKGSGETLRLTERFTRVDASTIEYRYTVDDPKVFVRPWTAVTYFTLDRWADEGKQDRIFEYSCHEHNYGMANALGAARVDEKWSHEEAAREDRARLPQLQAEWEKLKRWEQAKSR